MLVANKIVRWATLNAALAAGRHHVRCPIGINEKMRKILLEVNRAKTTGQRLSLLSKIRPSMLVKPTVPRNGEPRTGLSMGEHCEQMAQEWGISREDQDQLAWPATKIWQPLTNAVFW